MSWLRFVAVAAVTAALGYLAGAARPAPGAPVARGAAPVVAAVREPLGPMALRAIVREELARPSAAATPPPAAPPPVPEATPEQLAAREKARTVVAQAIAVRRWGPTDRAELHALLPQLSRAEHDEIMATLVPAINEGRLTVEIDGPFL
jgi:hypothetical protein